MSTPASFINEQAPPQDIWQSLCDYERFGVELLRMMKVDYIPFSLDSTEVAPYQEKIAVWLETFAQADQFIADNDALIRGNRIIPSEPLVHVTQSHNMNNVFRLAIDPPPLTYFPEPEFSRGDHEIANALRIAAMKAMFVRPGSIDSLSYGHGVETDDERILKRHKRDALVKIWGIDALSDCQVADKITYLIYHQDLMIHSEENAADIWNIQKHYHVEFDAKNQSYLLLLNVVNTNAITELIMRKRILNPDKSFDVITLRLHPNPVFVHYASKDRLTHYAVPILGKPSSFIVVPGVHSPDVLKTPVTTEDLQRFTF